MMNLWSRNFFSKDKQTHQADSYAPSPFKVDIHSHLLPGIDDGSADLAQSIELIKIFEKMGYQKLITTPHVMGDFYRNTPSIIREKLALLKTALQENNIKVEIEAAAEYYFDEWFIHKIRKGEELLTFGQKYILFETGFMDIPRQLFEIIFEMQAQGFQPVFAHPERYSYLQSDFGLLTKIYEKGVKLQLNLNSFNGYYGKVAKDLANKIADKGWVSFVGTDCHKIGHLQQLHKTFEQSSSFQNLSLDSILNNTL